MNDGKEKAKMEWNGIDSVLLALRVASFFLILGFWLFFFLSAVEECLSVTTQNAASEF